MIYALGPRAQRVYRDLRERLLNGGFAPGDRLSSHVELAAEFGVATLTVRQVLAELEREGLVSREQGRGTFARQAMVPTVLIVDDEDVMRALLRAHVTQSGFRVVEADSAPAALAALEADHSISLVLSDVRMPTTADGIGLIRAVQRRWPDLPLAAITGFPDDLGELHGTPEYPVLVLSKPVWARQIATVLNLTLRSATSRIE